jgi:hypothetical protein
MSVSSYKAVEDTVFPSGSPKVVLNLVSAESFGVAKPAGRTCCGKMKGKRKSVEEESEDWWRDA